MLQTIAIDNIVPAKDNVRRRLSEIKDLAASVASVGVIEPLLVSPEDDGTFVVVAGHRRLLAARQAGITELPCTVRKLTDAERVEIMLAENVARCSLTPVEEASGYFRLIEFGLPMAEIGRRIGRSARHISGRLALLELPRAVQAKVDSGKVTVAEATALLALKDHPDVIDRILEDEWSRGDLERAVVREWPGSRRKRRSPRPGRRSNTRASPSSRSGPATADAPASRWQSATGTASWT